MVHMTILMIGICIFSIIEIANWMISLQSNNIQNDIIEDDTENNNTQNNEKSYKIGFKMDDLILLCFSLIVLSFIGCIVYIYIRCPRFGRRILPTEPIVMFHREEITPALLSENAREAFAD